MTTPHHPIAADGLLPPPGCPAHGAASALVRVPEITDPARTYEDLRQRYGPVAPVLLHGDLPAWMVLGYRENLEVMRTSSLYSRDSRRWSAFRENRVAADSPLLPIVGWQPIAAFTDGEEHARLRCAVVDGLGQFNRRGMRRYVTHYTRQLVSGFAKSGSADLVRDYAEPLPMLVVSRLLGMSPEKGPLLVEPTLDLIRGSATAATSNAVVTQVLQELVAHKRTAPGDYDLTSRLISHESALTDKEVVEHLRLILVAAHQGTVNLIAHTLRLMLTDRRFRGRLSGGSMTLPDALEQVMWDNPSIGVIPGRWAVGDHVLAGQHIKEGDLLLLCIAAANVDPEVRPDLTASMHGNRAHLALSSGPHECPGGDIGRAIADTGIEELMVLLPDIRLSVLNEEIGVTANWMTSRPATLPVAFTPPRGLAAPLPGSAPPKAQPLPVATEPAAAPVASPTTWRSRWRSLLSR